MNKHEFKQSINELHERLLALTAAKGEEYTQRAQSQFANFEASAARLGLTREQVLMVALDKHMFSVTTWVNDSARGEAREYAEPITGRVDDAILYLLLLRGMMVERLAPGIAGERAGEALTDHHWLLQGDVAPVPAIPTPHAIVCRNPARAAQVRGHHRASCHTTTHPDNLHGIPAGSAVWLVREDGDGHFADEVGRACAKRGLRLYFVAGPDCTVGEAPADA